jgi:hypothetical protein
MYCLQLVFSSRFQKLPVRLDIINVGKGVGASIVAAVSSASME